MKIILDTSKLDRLRAEMPGKVDTLMGKLAADYTVEINTHWSRESPSTPGEPPAVDTGNLKNSIVASPEKPGRWVVNIGAKYAPMLEFGTPVMAARPFAYPALLRLKAKAGGLIRKVIR